MEEAKIRVATRPYGGYDVVRSDRIDAELTHVDKGSPGGEYLRRFWQPVAMTSEVKELPLAIKILGEELVLFRTRLGEYALLHRHCSHRGASLEFGLIVDNGIRCAYHGWHYAIDGHILEVPAETKPGAITRRMCHGAYPVREFKGILFAYMGPPDLQPALPTYDFMAAEGEDCVPYCWPVPCNWLQVRENTQDPIHLTFLHSMFSIKQFGDLTLDIPYIRAYETSLGQITTSVRRVGDLYYCRVNEMIMPNLAKLADALREGDAIPNNERSADAARDADGRSTYRRLLPASHGLGLSMWVVPLDNESCMFIGWHHVPDDEPQAVRDERIRQVAHGQMADRPYSERQRNPGDHDAMVSQGINVSRDNDNLTLADAGVATYRRQLRAGIRAVQEGKVPKGLDRPLSGVIPTYAYALVRPAAEPGNSAEEQANKQAFEREVARQVLALQVPHTPRVLVRAEDDGHASL